MYLASHRQGSRHVHLMYTHIEMEWLFRVVGSGKNLQRIHQPLSTMFVSDVPAKNCLHVRTLTALTTKPTLSDVLGDGDGEALTPMWVLSSSQCLEPCLGPDRALSSCDELVGRVQPLRRFAKPRNLSILTSVVSKPEHGRIMVRYARRCGGCGAEGDNPM